MVASVFLVANRLRWQLGRHNEVHEEVPVRKRALQIDLHLLHQERGELPATIQHILAGLVEFLARSPYSSDKYRQDYARAVGILMQPRDIAVFFC